MIPRERIWYENNAGRRVRVSVVSVLLGPLPARVVAHRTADLLTTREVGAEPRGSFEVDVLDLVGAQLRVDVDEDADAALQTSGYPDFGEIQQRHERPAHPPGRRRGELRDEVRRDREQRRGDVVRDEPVALDDRLQEMFRRVEDQRRFVAGHGGRPADAPHDHARLASSPGDAAAPFASAKMRRSAVSSRSVAGRTAPGARSPSEIGPKRSRTSATTGCSTTSNIRRTWRFRPSCNVMSTSETSRRTATTRSCAGAARPSSSRTPRKIFSTAAGSSRPRSVARYVFSTPKRGWVRTFAVSPPSLRSTTPLVSQPSRPTATPRAVIPARRTTSATVRRPSGSRIVVITPTGLCSTTYERVADGRTMRPSTSTRASSSTLVPSSRTTRPATRTRPATINSSARRRDATPAAARYF